MLPVCSLLRVTPSGMGYLTALLFFERVELERGSGGHRRELTECNRVRPSAIKSNRVQSSPTECNQVQSRPIESNLVRSSPIELN